MGRGPRSRLCLRAALGLERYQPGSRWRSFCLESENRSESVGQSSPEAGLHRPTRLQFRADGAPHRDSGGGFSRLPGWHLRAYDTSNGLIIWDFNTVQDFSTINSVTARGGSLNGAGPAIADGMVYVQSGYTNDLAGNVLLAFGPDDE